MNDQSWFELCDKYHKAQEEIKGLKAQVELLEKENEELSNVIGRTRDIAICAMDEIRSVLGVPLGREDKSPKRVVDYVRDLVESKKK